MRNLEYKRKKNRYVDRLEGCINLVNIIVCTLTKRDKNFPGGSIGKESAYNAGHSISIPRSGRSTGEGIGYPLHYSWASLVAQIVKNLPAMWET